jgi:hypothetical protein
VKKIFLTIMIASTVGTTCFAQSTHHRSRVQPHANVAPPVTTHAPRGGPPGTTGMGSGANRDNPNGSPGAPPKAKTGPPGDPSKSENGPT